MSDNPSLFTPGDTRRTIEAVDAASRVLADNMVASDLAGSPFAKDYVQWVIRFRKFMADNSSSVRHAMNSVYDEAQKYAGELKDWSARFQDLTKKKVVVPEPKVRKPLRKAMKEAVVDATEIVIAPAVTLANKLGVVLAVVAGAGIVYLVATNKK